MVGRLGARIAWWVRQRGSFGGVGGRPLPAPQPAPAPHPPRTMAPSLQAGLSGLAFDEGQFGVFGYVTGGAEVLPRLRPGDVLASARLVSGGERLVVPGGGGGGGGGGVGAGAGVDGE